MVTPLTRDLVDTAQHAGYQVLIVEHPRSTRWLLTLRDSLGTSIMLVIQARSLIGAADVQDLDELVRVRQLQRGLFWAYGGTFSTAAHRTCAELGALRLTLCTALPSATPIEG
ncbi:MAG: hypothetical protein ABI901_00305 [Roseiflexaceae bacterium]